MVQPGKGANMREHLQASLYLLSGADSPACCFITAPQDKAAPEGSLGRASRQVTSVQPNSLTSLLQKHYGPSRENRVPLDLLAKVLTHQGHIAGRW